MNRVRAKTGFICSHGDVRRHTVPPERHKSGVSRISTRPFRRPSPSNERPEGPRKMKESKVIQHMNMIRTKIGFICAHGDVRRHTVPQERHKSGVFQNLDSAFPPTLTVEGKAREPKKDDRE